MTLSTEQIKKLLPLSFDKDGEHITMLHGEQAQAMSELIHDYQYAICKVFQEGRYLEMRNTNYKPRNIAKYPSRVDFVRKVRAELLTPKEQKNVPFNDDDNQKAAVAPSDIESTVPLLSTEELNQNLEELNKKIDELFPVKQERKKTKKNINEPKTARNFRKSFKKFRDKLLATVTPDNGLFATVTSDQKWKLQEISKHIQTFSRVIKYNYKNVIKCMFVALEPHANGSWHAHIIFVFNINIKEIENLSEIKDNIKKWWSNKNDKYSDKQVIFKKIADFAENHKNKDAVVGLINYLDVNKNPKKQKRLKYYPQHAHVLRVYGQCNEPIIGALSYTEGERLRKECAGNAIPALSELFIRFNDDGTVLNISSATTYYTTMDAICQVATQFRNVAENLEALKFKAWLKRRIKLIHKNTVDTWFLKFSPYAVSYRHNYERYGQYI